MENSDADPIPGVFSTAFWVATVLRIQGYKVSSFFTNPSFLFNLSLEMNEFAAGAFALWRLWPRWYQRLLDEPLQWKGVVITYNNLIKRNLNSFYIFRFTQWAGVPQKGNPWFPRKAFRWPHCLLSIWVNCWIVRQSITTGRSFSWKDWLELALCQQHSIRYPQEVLNFDLISRVKPLPIIGIYLTWFSRFFVFQVVWESVSSCFKKGMKLEVVDKMRISQVSAYPECQCFLQIWLWW